MTVETEGLIEKFCLIEQRGNLWFFCLCQIFFENEIKYVLFSA